MNCAGNASHWHRPGNPEVTAGLGALVVQFGVILQGNAAGGNVMG